MNLIFKLKFYFVDELKREDIESLMHAFKSMNGNSVFSNTMTANSNKKKLKKLTINDCLRCYDQKIQEELSKLK